MPLFRIGRTPQEATVAGGTVSNRGAGILFYGGPSVSQTAFDGQLASGAHATLAGNRWIVSDSECWVDLDPAPLASADQRYEPRVPRLVAPALFGGQIVSPSTGTNTINRGVFCRVVIPEDGVLHGFSIYGAGAFGNVIGFVYDVGEQTPTVRTLLWQSAVQAPLTLQWVVLGDPNLQVVAGQHLDFGFVSDQGAVGFARVTSLSNLEILPAGIGVARGGCSARYAYTSDFGAFAPPATLAEGALAGLSTVPLILAAV